MRRLLVVPLATLVSIFSAHVFCQVSWQKHESNPVLPHWGGNVDDPSAYRFLLEPCVLRDSATGLLRMWFVSLASGYGTRGCLSEAVSTDGSNWFVYAKNPIMRPGPTGSFDSRFIFSGEVLPSRSGYLMYYTGQDENGKIALGLAVSRDGREWQKHRANPILTAGSPGAWDCVWVGYPRVVLDGSTYYMWYAGYDGTYTSTGLATSADGVNWTKHTQNPVVRRGSPGTWDCRTVGPAGVVKVGSTLYMLYTGSSSSSGPAHAGLALSSDGVGWTKHGSNPVISPGAPGQWDDRQICGGSLRFKGGTFYYWYCATGSATEWQIGLATSSLTRFPVHEDDLRPKSSWLDEAYPNPFNAQTRITFEIPREEQVSLSIYNSLGQQVNTLVNGVKRAGKHSIDWDAKDVPSGVYWYRLTAGDYRESKKLMLIK